MYRLGSNPLCSRQHLLCKPVNEKAKVLNLPNKTKGWLTVFHKMSILIKYTVEIEIKNNFVSRIKLQKFVFHKFLNIYIPLLWKIVNQKIQVCWTLIMVSCQTFFGIMSYNYLIWDIFISRYVCLSENVSLSLILWHENSFVSEWIDLKFSNETNTYGLWSKFFLVFLAFSCS